jgi:hypothetical protein
MNPLVSKILKRHDHGDSVSTIATAEQVSFGHVYSTLRQHRPARPRQPRTRTSKKRKFILGLLAAKIAAPRVAFLASVTPAYVYALIKQEAAT